jgi:hypothetical protein
MRVFYSMCQLQSIEDSSKRFVLLSILTTFCTNNRNDFLVFDTKFCKTYIWQRYNEIKNFVCIPEASLDIEEMQKHMLIHYDRLSLLYSDNRLIPIDTHDPSNTNESQYRDAEFCNSRLQYWQLRRGIRSIDACPVSISEVYNNEGTKQPTDVAPTSNKDTSPSKSKRGRHERAAKQKRSLDNALLETLTGNNVKKRQKRAPATKAASSAKTNARLDILTKKYSSIKQKIAPIPIVSPPSTQKGVHVDVSSTVSTNKAINSGVLEEIRSKLSNIDNFVKMPNVTKASDNQSFNQREDYIRKHEEQLKKDAEDHLRIMQSRADAREERRRQLEDERNERLTIMRFEQMEKARANAHQRSREKNADYLQLIEALRTPKVSMLDVNCCSAALSGKDSCSGNSSSEKVSGKLTINEEQLLESLLLRRLKDNEESCTEEED